MVCIETTTQKRAVNCCGCADTGMTDTMLKRMKVSCRAAERVLCISTPQTSQKRKGSTGTELELGMTPSSHITTDIEVGSLSINNLKIRVINGMEKLRPFLVQQELKSL